VGKARMSEFVGTKDGLSAERAYTFRTLPAGVLRGLADAVLRTDLAGLGRAAAIIGGLAFTVAGYLRHKVQARLSGRRLAADKLSMHANERVTLISAGASYRGGQENPP